MSASTLALEPVVVCGRLIVDPARCAASVDGRELVLTVTEARLLLYLARRIGALCCKRAIIATVWGEHWLQDGMVASSEHCLRVAICRLRGKLGPCRSQLRTRDGLGYWLEAITPERSSHGD